MTAFHLVATTAASPLWFATRAAGTMTIMLLTLTVVLGISAGRRWESAATPRFVTALVHRNVSLFTLAFLTVHIVTAVADPFALLHPLDALVPFLGVYRTTWLALGVIAFEILVALIVTSLLRTHISRRAWRMTHWASYACWPLAMMHGLGTGTDAQAPWMIGVTSACAAAVIIALFARLARGRWQTLPLRVALAVAGIAVFAAIATWTIRGPLQPGWVVASGTPGSILAGNSRQTFDFTHRGNFSDPLIGVLTKNASGSYVSLRDTVDTALTVVIAPPPRGETLPVVTVARGGRTICAVPATVTTTFYAVCGASRLVISLEGGAQYVVGTLTSSGPLA